MEPQKQLKDNNQLLLNIVQNFVNSEKVLEERQQVILHFFAVTKQYLAQKNCSFGYQNKNSHKHGHFKQRIVDGKIVKQEIKIERNELLPAQIYVTCHELAHFINNHPSSKELTGKQKEIVADTVALMFLKNVGLYYWLPLCHVSEKWDPYNYSTAYLNNMAVSAKRVKLIEKQILQTHAELINIYFKG